MSASYDTLREKLSHFDTKSWITGGTKIRPGKVSNWRIFQSNWLNIESQIDSTFRVKFRLNIQSQIDSTFRVKSTQHSESNRLNIGSQIDWTLRVKLTEHWESNWLNIESQIDSNILQLPTLLGRILVLPVTQLFRIKWLNFFSRCIVGTYAYKMQLVNQIYYSRLV